MKRLFLALVFVLAATPHQVQSQDAEARYVRVKVVNGATGQAVSGAKVTFAVPYGQTAESTATNTSGLAQLRLVRLPDNIYITKPGWLPASTTVNAENVNDVILVYAEQGQQKQRRPPTRRRKH